MRKLFTESQRRFLREAAYEVDSEARSLARSVWRELIVYFRSHDPEVVRIGAMRGIMVKSPKADLPKGLSVVLLPHGSGEVAAYSQSPQLGQVITLYGVGPDDLKSAKVRTAFVHEFVHYLDRQRFKGRGEHGARSRRAVARGDEAGYVRTPAEFNAYYQQVADQIEDYFNGRLQGLMRLGPKAPVSVRERLLEIFASFTSFRGFILGNTSPASDAGHLERLFKGTKWERKWTKRLHTLYTGLKVEVEKAL